MENLLVYLPYAIMLLATVISLCIKGNFGEKIVPIIFLAIVVILVMFDSQVGKAVFVIAMMIFLVLAKVSYEPYKGSMRDDIKQGAPYVWTELSLMLMVFADALKYRCVRMDILWVQVPVALLFAVMVIRYAWVAREK